MIYLCLGRNHFWKVRATELIFREQAGGGYGGGGDADGGLDGRGGAIGSRDEGDDIGDDGDGSDDSGLSSAWMTCAQMVPCSSLSPESHIQLPHCHPLLCLAGLSHSQYSHQIPLSSLAFLCTACSPSFKPVAQGTAPLASQPSELNAQESV